MYKHLDEADLRGLPEKVVEFLDVPGRGRCLGFNRHGTLLAVGCEDGSIVILDFQTHAVDRTLRGHAKEVTSVTWSRSGRQLLSSSLDGRLQLWDVEASASLEVLQLPAGVRSVSVWRRDLDRPLASLERGPAQLVTLSSGAHSELPALAMEGEGRSARALFGSLGAGGKAQHGAYSACGRYVFAATKGTVAVLRRSDLALLDVVKLQGLPATLGLCAAPARGGRGATLLVNAADGAIRLYNLQPRAAAEERALGQEEVEEAVAQKMHKVGSPVYPESSTYLQLSMTWRAVPPVESQGFAAAILSRDREHALGAADTRDEQLVYFWSTQHSGFEQVLECGSDGAVALALHPCTRPMQLLTVGASGRIYIWARLFAENWSAFAPGFQELAENRELFEREDEFDVNPRPDDPGAAMDEGEEEEVDVVGGGLEALSEDEYATDYEDDPADNCAGGTSKETPLLFLPAHVQPKGAAAAAPGGKAAAGKGRRPAAAAPAAAGGDDEPMEQAPAEPRVPAAEPAAPGEPASEQGPPRPQAGAEAGGGKDSAGAAQAAAALPEEIPDSDEERAAGMED